MHINQVVKEAKDIDNQIKELQMRFTAYKLKIQEYFDKKDVKSLSVPSDKVSQDKSTTIVASKIERITINYLVDKLKEKFSKEVCNEIITKTYTVHDMEGLVRLLKEHDVSPKDFKKYIAVHENVDKDKIKQLYAIGDITKKQLAGCFEAKISKSIQIKEVVQECEK